MLIGCQRSKPCRSCAVCVSPEQTDGRRNRLDGQRDRQTDTGTTLCAFDAVPQLRCLRLDGTDRQASGHHTDAYMLAAVADQTDGQTDRQTLDRRYTLSVFDAVP